MRIKLLKDLPVSKEHGMTAGREFKIAFERPYAKGKRTVYSPLWFVMGDAGEPVGVLSSEAVILERPKDATCPGCGVKTTHYRNTSGWGCGNDDCLDVIWFTLYPEPEATDG